MRRAFTFALVCTSITLLTPAPLCIAAAEPAASNRVRQIGGVTVYHKIDFDADDGGFKTGDGAEIGPTDDAVDRKALRVDCRKGWTPRSQPEADFNRHLIELCRKLEIPTGYIFEGFQEKGPGNRRTYMGGDGVHWTGAGMAIGGRAWGKALDQVRFVLRDRQ